MKTLKKYLKIWYLMTGNSFSLNLISRFSAIVFVAGKFIRFLFLLGFLMLLLGQTKTLAGFNLSQTMLFYLTFNIVDTVSQLFLREVYRFRPMVVSGNFDLVLTKPVNPLFRILTGGTDPFDLVMLVVLLVFTVIFLLGLKNVLFINVIFYFLLCFNGFLIAAAFHILVAAVGILTTEIDHTIMIYRDLSSLGRVPVDIYQEPLRFFITFIIPVGVMMTFPAKALLGLLSWQGISLSFFLGAISLWLSFSIWKYSLTKYASASS